MRPASSQRRCFYCREPVGGRHKETCVLVKKRVRINVQVALSYEITVPANWTADDVEYHRNEGSWCADNALSEFAELGGCLCGSMTTRFLRDVGGVFLEEDGHTPAENKGAFESAQTTSGEG